uniref:YDG domain-containing protein n=1 Tax=Selenomonas ruminantium TaxID=971 RepID=UPI00156A06DC
MDYKRNYNNEVLKMRRDKRQKQIALQVSIALMAGMFSFVPVSYGAPVGGVVKNGSVDIKPFDASTNTLNINDTAAATGTPHNNVIDWQDFSIAKGETVQFDDGAKTNNYMNIVTGANTSNINGTLKGGNEVYIVNPNGVIFGKDASVDVGSFYASTREVAVNDAVTAATAGDMKSIIAAGTSTSGAAMDIVNMGKISADKVVLEGENIRLLNSADITATNGVTVRADEGYIHVGSTDGTGGAGYVSEKLTASGTAATVEQYTLVDSTNWNTTLGTGAAVSGNYMLAENIDASDETKFGEANPFKTVTGTFSGKLDGNFYEVSNVSGAVGLFTNTQNATIENLGVKNSSFTNSAKNGAAGAIVSVAGSGTVLNNVYNDGSSVKGSKSLYSGGLVGNASGVTITNSYNTGSSYSGGGGGLIGVITGGTNVVKNSYSTGSANGLVFSNKSGGTIEFENVFGKANKFFDSHGTSTAPKGKNSVVYNSSYKYYDSTGIEHEGEGSFDKTALANYNTNVLSLSDTDITNTGGLIHSGTKLVSPTWRIYEGQAAPLLRSFLTANGTVTVNYDYTHGSESGSNGGADLTANDLTYNGSPVKVKEGTTPSYSGVGNIDTSKINIDSDGVKNAATKALFYTDQQGYDLIGNNVTMAKKQLSLSGSSMGITKVYDKSADATSAVTTILSTATNISGVVSGDDVSLNPAGITAKYVDADGNEDATVGSHNITLAGTVKLTGTDEGNYKLEATDLSTLDNVTGTITHRPIYLISNLDDVNFTKNYDGNNSLSITNSAGDALSGDDIFSLETTSSSAGTQNPNHGKISGDDVSLAFGGTGTPDPEYVDVVSGDFVSTNKAANAGEHSVRFSGIALSGDDSANYALYYNGTTNPVTNSQVLLKSGVDVNTGAADSIRAVIRPRLLATDGFQVQTPTGQVDSTNNPIYTKAAANKTYDGTTNYTVPTGAKLVANTAAADSNTGLLAADAVNLWFSLSDNNVSNFVDSTGAITKMAAGAKAAVGVAYAVEAKTNTNYEHLKGNYTFESATATSDTVSNWKTLNDELPTVSGAGTISRRNITIDTNNVLGINKPYDGNDKVVGDNYTKIGGGYLDYATDSPSKLLVDDPDAVAASVTDDAAWSVTASYDNKNVVRAADDSVPNNAKNVFFNVSITGDDAVNYTLNSQAAETGVVPLTGKGKITPLVLTPDFVDISKTYNGTTSITDGDSSTPGGTVTGLSYVSGGTTVTDDVKLSFAPAKAYYENANAGSHTIYYPELSLTGNDRVNYDLNSTTGTGNGTIYRRLILTDGFQVLNGGTTADGTKVYDGTSTYTLPEGATLVNTGTTTDNTGIIEGDQENLWFKLSGSTPSNFVNGSGSTTSKVAEAVGIAYQTEAVTKPGYENLLGNYKIGTTTSSTPLAADTTYAVTGGGNITRRAININIDIQNAKGINKVYDQTTALVGAGDTSVGGDYLKYISGSAETSKLLADDSTASAAAKESDNAAWSVNATYDNKNVVWENGVVPEDGKTVNFNISITGSDAANYTLNGVNAETTAAAPLNLTGTGKIDPKPLTATFDPVTKVYTGTTLINDRDPNETGNGKVTPLTGDTVYLNTYNPNEAYYDTPDVGTNKTIYYPNLSIGGADSSNYVLSSTTGVSTSNSITTATVTLADFVFDFADVIRTYNGTTAVADSTQGITAEQFIKDSYIKLGAGKFEFGDYIRNLNAHYAAPNVSANTGTGNVTYSFNLDDITIPNISIEGDYQNYYAENPVTKGVGTINPKTVYATINNPVVTKTYNGALDVQASTPLVSYNGLVGSSSDATTAAYLDKNQGTDKLVQYDVKISDGSNYIIQYNGEDPNMTKYTTSAGGPAITADTPITTVVTPNNIINPKDLPITFKDVTKQYDGTTDVLPAQVALGAATTGAVESGDNISLDSWEAAYNSPDVLVANTVDYQNIVLSGNDNGNYKFVDANGNPLTSSTVIQGNGAITPYALSGTYAFKLGNVTKEYDSTNAIKYTGTAGGTTYYRDGSEAAIKNFITAPTVTVNGQDQEMAYALDMDKTHYDDKTVGEHNANFRVGISSSNYDFSNITVTDGTNTLTPTFENGVYYYNLAQDNAQITPRRVNLALNDSPLITKIYDGTKAVEQTVTGKDNKVYMTDSADFISGDNVDVDWNNISAVYDDENAGNRNVLYTVGLTGTDAGNYELYKAADGTAITDTNKLTETGSITPRELTVDFVRDEHIYNNSAAVTNAGNNLQFGNKAAKDAGFTLDDEAKALINGIYTDENVNRAADGTVLDKGLTYNNLQNALSDYATRNAIAKNYTIAVDSVTYSESDGKGIIKPLTITDPLKAVWQTTGVDKTYDATTKLPDTVDKDSVLKLQVNTAYDGILNLQAGDAGYQYDTNTVGYETKNQGDRALTYTVTGVNPNQGNYQLSDTVVSAALAAPWVSTDTARNMDGNAATGHISPRTLTIVTEKDSKIYDGLTDVANAKSKIHFTTEDQALINKDTDAVDYTVMANYLDKNAGDGITIDYTLTLTGNDNGNYVLNSGTGTAVGTTTGDIARRKVYVEPVDVDGIDKVYDKTTDLPEGFTNTGRFKLADTDDTTGIVAGEEDIQLDFDAIQGKYDSEHAGPRTITFNNFNLVDTNLLNDNLVDNYTVETSSINGSGTISPKGLVVGIKAAPTKEYDTFNNISDYYAGVGNLYLHGESVGDAGVIGDDQVNLQVNSADYIDANAGKNKEYSYGISIDNADYKLVQGNNLPAITVSNDGQSGTVTAYDGEIIKRKVYVSLADAPDIVKTYDGNTGVIQDVTNKIIVRDGDLLDDGTELNRDADVINAHYDFKDAGDREVFYTAQLKGDAA